MFFFFIHMCISMDVQEFCTKYDILFSVLQTRQGMGENCSLNFIDKLCENVLLNGQNINVDLLDSSVY